MIIVSGGRGLPNLHTIGTCKGPLRRGRAPESLAIKVGGVSQKVCNTKENPNFILFRLKIPYKSIKRFKTTFYWTTIRYF